MIVQSDVACCSIALNTCGRRQRQGACLRVGVIAPPVSAPHRRHNEVDQERVPERRARCVALPPPVNHNNSRVRLHPFLVLSLTARVQLVWAVVMLYSLMHMPTRLPARTHRNSILSSAIDKYNFPHFRYLNHTVNARASLQFFRRRGVRVQSSTIALPAVYIFVHWYCRLHAPCIVL